MRIGYFKMNSTNRLIELRMVRQEDCEILWKWVNDPFVRAASFASEPITWEDHLKWFNNRINSSNCYHFIAFNDQNAPIGQIRFDVDEQSQAEIDISIDLQKRGQGYAAPLITLAVNHMLTYTTIECIHAFIKPINNASIKAFQKSKFQYVDIKKIRGKYSAFHYVFLRNNKYYLS